MRGIFPVVATVTARAYERVDDDELAQRTTKLLERPAHSSAAEGCHDDACPTTSPPNR